MDALAEARALADPLPHLLLWVDVDGHIRFLNRYYTELTRQDRDEAVVQQGWREHVHPEDLEGFCAVLRNGPRGEGGVQFEFRLRHADGSYRWMLLSARGGEDPASGKPWQAVATDIQARRSAEQALQDLQRTFDERLARQTAELAASC